MMSEYSSSVSNGHGVHSHTASGADQRPGERRALPGTGQGQGESLDAVSGGADKAPEVDSGVRCTVM
jgi:hypothetical protein